MELGMGEILVIVVLVLLFFGPSKLPQLGDALGKGIRNFKKAASTDEPTPTSQVEASPALPAGNLRNGPAAAAGQAVVHGSTDPE